MNDTSRRRFLGVVGAGAITAGAATVLPDTALAHEARLHPDSASESLVAHVADPASDEVTLLVGEREVVVHDRDLVTRLLNAAGR
jgi:hypothetical protein